MTDTEQHIEREVQRRVGVQAHQLNQQIEVLRDVVRDQNNKLAEQHGTLNRLLGKPTTFGTLLSVSNTINPTLYKPHDEIVVCDSTSEFFREGGKIISGLNNTQVIDNEGFSLIKLFSGIEVELQAGIEGKSAQFRLSQKNDGTSAVVSVDGKPWEVMGIPDLSLEAGEFVKVDPDTKAIIGKAPNIKAGPICQVLSVTPKGVEVSNRGDKFLVFNSHKFGLIAGDLVVCDHDIFCIVDKLDRVVQQNLPEFNVSWNDIGGLEQEKQELRDTIELQFTQPDLFSYYGIQPTRGVLLYGPPGCGKGMLIRACATAISKLHGKDNGIIYVKSPELLSKWIGETEATIRDKFEQGREFFRQNGFKTLLVFDEADAILPERGTRLSSDISDTIVPMFLGEMDGIDDRQTRENPIVVLMTNRNDILDPAVVRPGRISKHIKVNRPDSMTSIEILDIHTRNLPFADEKNRMAVLAIAVSDLFSKNRLLYKINNEHIFTMGDVVSGALLYSLAETAKTIALHRDIYNKSKGGVIVEDFRTAVSHLNKQQRGVNHSYDLRDFSEKLGLQPESIRAERCFAAS